MLPPTSSFRSAVLQSTWWICHPTSEFIYRMGNEIQEIGTANQIIRESRDRLFGMVFILLLIIKFIQMLIHFLSIFQPPEILWSFDKFSGKKSLKNRELNWINWKTFQPGVQPISKYHSCFENYILFYLLGHRHMMKPPFLLQ